MKPITKEETLNNKFCKCNKHTGQVIIVKPSKEQASKMRMRTLCLYIASSGLKFRNVEKATENANLWLNSHTKSEVIDMFF